MRATRSSLCFVPLPLTARPRSDPLAAGRTPDRRTPRSCLSELAAARPTIGTVVLRYPSRDGPRRRSRAFPRRDCSSHGRKTPRYLNSRASCSATKKNGTHETKVKNQRSYCCGHGGEIGLCRRGSRSGHCRITSRAFDTKQKHGPCEEVVTEGRSESLSTGTRWTIAAVLVQHRRKEDTLRQGRNRTEKYSVDLREEEKTTARIRGLTTFFARSSVQYLVESEFYDSL